MSSATNAFEDLGYFCIDNLPTTMLPTFARLVTSGNAEQGIERAAIVIDIREGTFLAEFGKQLADLRAAGLGVYVLFLEASDDVLQHRFSETRRPHPADKGQGLLHAIRAERTAMARVRAEADQIIDTSDHTVHTLRSHLLERFSPDRKGSPMRVQVLSFGHKYGSPGDLELLFDVRHLPNPHFLPELKPLSGHDRRVVQYLKQQPEVEETLSRFGDLLDYLLAAVQARRQVVCNCRNWLHRRPAPFGDGCECAGEEIAKRWFRCPRSSSRREKIQLAAPR